MKQYMVFDIGGSGGRSSIVGFDGQRLNIISSSSFVNNHISIRNNHYWNVLSLYQSIIDQIHLHSRENKNISSIAIDTMGVNFALLDKNDELLGNVLYSRVPQKKEIKDYAFDMFGGEKNLYFETGLQTNKLNSLYRLLDIKMRSPNILENTKTFLMLVDLINFWLTGNKTSEYTMSSTSFLLNAETKTWSKYIVEKLGINISAFNNISPSGTLIGSCDDTMLRLLGNKNISVIATASHDTASALSCIRPEKDNYAYISSGTWGMLGCKSEKPIINDLSFKYNFCNEGSSDGNIRFLYNSVNLWILNRCREYWKNKGRIYTWDELSQMASRAKPFQAFIDIQYQDFLISDNMPETILSICHSSGQSVGETAGDITRVVLESLAMKYKYLTKRLEQIKSYRVEVIYIVGGGSSDDLLNQFTSNACGVPVVSGPKEATIFGNVFYQMIGLGDINCVEDGYKIIENSYKKKYFEPIDSDLWLENYNRFESILSGFFIK